MAFLEQENLLPVIQSTYRKYHSTETAILKIVTKALLAAGHDGITLLGLLESSAAFYTVGHDFLTQRIHISFSVRGSDLAWIN